MSNPLVSIIVPVYGVEKFLPRCLDSIITQTYKNIEVILVDDESPDSCGEICDHYAVKDNRIKVIHKKNAGVNEARITGFSKSIGDYITFIDSDDYVSTFYVEHLLKCIIDQNVVMSCVQRIYIKGKREIPDVRFRFGRFDTQGITDILKNDFLFSYKDNTNAFNLGLCCKMIKREWLAGAMEQARGLWVGEDLITNLYIVYRVPSMFISTDHLYYYVQHISQSSRNGGFEAWNNQIAQWERILELDTNGFLIEQLSYRMLSLLKIYVRNNVEQSEFVYRDFRDHMKHALQQDIVKIHLINYTFPYLRIVDKLFLFFVKTGKYYLLYLLFKIAIPVRRMIKNIIR
jgi:glycosyltransferase involved in cell wall biosynthesis